MESGVWMGDNKPVILGTLDQALEERSYIERSVGLPDEAMVFEEKPDGTLGAVEGKRDDEVIATAGGLWLGRKNPRFGPPRVVRWPKPDLVEVGSGMSRF